MTKHILIAEDDPSQRVMLAKLLETQLGYRVTQTANGAEAVYYLKKAEEPPVDAVLLDLDMPEMDGKQALKTIRKTYDMLPVIILTARDDFEGAIELMRLGAADFMRKPANVARLSISLKNALKMQHLNQEVSRLKRQEQGKSQLDEMIGAKGGLKETTKLARRAAGSDITVMITGESGVGKEVLAQAIHGESTRAGKPFIAVNCGAIPKDLVESTLFGHIKGAFTGAISDAPGKFREADGGTLFLDEVGELPLEAQTKLLRVLQQREVEPVGSGTSMPVNVRIIAATNRDPATEVSKGHFREDLYFRLNVFPLYIQALRERRQDIPALAQHFLERYTALENKTIETLSKEAQDWLISHSWPGNIRELENMIYRAILLCDENILEKEHLFVHNRMLEKTDHVQNRTLPNTSEPSITLTKPDGTLKTIEEIKQETLEHALNLHQQNMTQTAKNLGISPATLYRWLS